MKNIAFIGIGVMGKSMARNLMKKGYNVYIYTRTKEKAIDIIEEGAIWCDTICECVKNKYAVITMVGYPKDVEEVYFGENGIIENVDTDTYIIDMTTTSPKLSVEIYNAAKTKNIKALDAPVSGGDTGAKNGTLSIMVGGDKEDFDACYDIFSAMGTTILYEGKAGFGQHTKMVNQILLSGCIASVCEAITYGKKHGLNIEMMFNSVKNGAAGSWQLSNNGAKIIDNDMSPGFFIKHYIKDMKIALEEAEAVGFKPEILKSVYDMYKCLEKEGMEDLGTQALIKYYEK